MRRVTLVGLLLVSALLTLGVSAVAAETSPGLAAHVYADSLLWTPGAATTVPSLNTTLDLNGLKTWPPGVTRDGWSLAAYGSLNVPQAGEYNFRSQGARTELVVGGQRVRLDGNSALRLPAGASPMALYLKNDQANKTSACRIWVRWKGPGLAEFEDIPVAALSHTAADAARAKVYRAWVPLQNPRTPVYNRRSWRVNLPQAGFWELTGPQANSVGIWEVMIDGHPVYYRQTRWGVTDQRLGLFGEHRVIRYLPAGTHEVMLYTNASYTWNDDIDRLAALAPLGFLLLGPDSPEQGLTVVPEGRDDLVFRQGERLTFSLEQMTSAPVGYRIDIREQRGAERPVWSQRVILPVNREHAKLTISYPCKREGAFEYTVSDDHGRIVDGPWAFVVVDPTPRPLPKASEGVAQPRKILVDSVDCTLPEDKVHNFRDSGRTGGASYVVETLAGKYRQAGDTVPYHRGYVKENGLWREAREGETATKSGAVTDWFAYTLRVKHPGRPHLLVVWVPNDRHRIMILQAWDQVAGTPQTAPIELGNAPQGARMVPVTMTVWPNGDMDFVTVNSSFPGWAEDRTGAVAKIELFECPDGFGQLPAAVGGWDSGRQFGFCGEQMDIGMEQRLTPKLWKGEGVMPNFFEFPHQQGRPYFDWKAFGEVWDRFGQYAEWYGQNTLIWPVYTYGMQTVINVPSFPQYLEAYSGGYASRLVDPYQRDMFKLQLLLAEKHRVKLVADFMVQRLEYEPQRLLPLDPSWTGKLDGVFITNLLGKAESMWGMGIPSPAHPLGRKWMIQLVRELGQQYGKYPAFGGFYTRNWPILLCDDGWWGRTDTSLDDYTVALFEKETGVKVPVTDTTVERFQLRYDWLMANAKDHWLKWRANKVYTLRREMLAELRKWAPQASLYSGATTDVVGSGGSSANLETGVDPEQVKGQPELGWTGWEHYGSHGFEVGGLDPICWRDFDQRLPEDQRPTLQQQINAQYLGYPSDLHTGVGSSVRAYPYVLEGAAESLARGQLDLMLWGGCWTLIPMDEGHRRFIQAWRALPKLQYNRVTSSPDEAVIAWQAKRGNELVFYLINRTPYAQEAVVSVLGGQGIRDLVSGKTLGSTQATIKLTAYMVAVLASRGAQGVNTCGVKTPPEFRADVDRQIATLRAANAKAPDHVEVLEGAGEKYTKVKYGRPSSEDLVWGRYDKTIKLADLLGPIEKAVQAQHWGQAQVLLDKLMIEHPWWYEAYGWPAGHYNYQAPRGAYATPAKMAAALQLSADTVKRVPGVPGTSVAVPGGKATMTLQADTAGKFDLKVWMLSGQGYGPVSVTVDGRKVGEIGVGTGAPYYAHFRLPEPLGLLDGAHEVSFESAGQLVLQAAEIIPVVPGCLKKWAAIGIFQGVEGWGWESMEKPFPPEQKVDLKGEYEGMGGKRIRWQQIDIGQDKFIQLLEKYYPYDNSKGGAVGYLAQWVYAPTERDVTFYYASDWFLYVWVNGQRQLDHLSGPWFSYATRKLHLKAGWNEILIKTAPGSTSWKVNVTLSDPGDMKYSPVPPE